MSNGVLQQDAIRISLPQLSGGRERARAMVEASASVQGLRGAVIVVDCRQLVAGTQSFADQLIIETLVDGGANLLVAEYARGRFNDFLLEAALDHGVADQLEVI